MSSELRDSGAPLPDAGKGTVARHQERAYDMSLSSEVNMTNCSEHRKRFFEKYASTDCNLLISYWMMAGYLGPVDSVEKAYQKGHDILMELTQRGILQSVASGEAKDMNKIKITEEDSNCRRHQGICDMKNGGFFDLLKLDELENVVPADGMLKSDRTMKSILGTNRRKRSILLIDGNHLSRQVFHSTKRLQCLAYFYPMPNSLKPLLENVKKLAVLLLRGCQFLSKIDLSFEKLTTLTVLEISGASHLTDIPEAIFSELTQLHCLNLSGLPIKQLPKLKHVDGEDSDPDQKHGCFSKLKQLRWLILRGCCKLEILPSIKDLTNLEVLDLSHCTSLMKLNSQQINSSHLWMIDLSYTKLKKVPQSKLSKQLTHLFLRDSELNVLHQVDHLTSLQVLDLSGAKGIKDVKKLLQHNDLKILDLSGTKITSIDSVSVELRKLLLKDCDQLTKLPDLFNLSELEELDLSGTKVRCLPSFANPSCLRKLSLRDLQLDSLETLASLSNLEALDLNGVKSSFLVELKFDFLKSLLKLQILNLSKTSVAELPSISKLTSLKELLLADCRDLNALPDLEPLLNLEILDLSLPDDSTTKEVQRGLSLSIPCSLRKLVLTNRSNVQNLVPLATPCKLESLDLYGTNVTEIPYEKLAKVKDIRLPAKIDHLKGMGSLKEEIVWPSKISQPSEIKMVPSIGKKSSLSAGANRFFHLQSNQGSCEWEAFVYQFSISQLPKKGGGNEVIYLEGDEFIFRNNHSWARRLLGVELQGRSIEILGFPEDDEGSHEDILKDIRDALRQAHNVALVGNDFSHSLSYLCSKAMKVCCIRRCHNMKSVLSGEGLNGCSLECPERIVLSHLLGLESICDDDTVPLPPESIKGVKHIHIDCCPRLKKVIAPQVPENLETLHIKFCDKLQTLFEENASLSRLKELSLFQLRKLEGITADLSSLRSLSISQCDKLENLDRVIKSARTSLKQLCLDSCPLLKHVLPSVDVPNNLKILKISSCSEVVTLFENTGSSSSSTCKLSSLQNLRLWDLPKLRDIGGKLSSAPDIELDPSLPQNIKQQLSSP